MNGYPYCATADPAMPRELFAPHTLLTYIIGEGLT